MTRSESPRPIWVGTISFALLWLVLTAPTPAPAFAAQPDEAGARVLFGEGRKLADAGRYAEACLKFEESLRLDAGVGTSFNLADCQEHLGRTASAWARFLDVAAATRLVGQPERERVARARAATLEPKLARLVVVVSAPMEGLTVERDGVPLGAAAWGIAAPVDPGPHVVAARGPGKKDWAQRTMVPDGPATIVVSVPALEARTQVDPPSAPAAGPILSPVPTLDARPVRRWSLPVVWVGALGAVGLVTGTVLAFEVRSENEEAKSLCPGSTCQTDQEKTRHDGLVADAKRDQLLAFASAGVGAAALLTAAYLRWRPGRPPSPRAAVADRFVVSPLVARGLVQGRGTMGGLLGFVW